MNGTYTNREVLSRIIAYLRPYKVTFFFAFILTLLSGLMGPLRPYLIGAMVAAFVTGGENEIAEFTRQYMTDDPREALLIWTVIIIALLFLEGIIQFYRTYLSAWLGQSAVKDIRIIVFRKLTSLKLKYFDKSPIGALVTRVVSDIEAISDVFSQGLLTIASDLLKIFTIIVFMLVINWQLALIVLIPVPLMYLGTKIFAKAMKKAFQQERKEVNNLNTFVQEHISGMGIIQIFNREKIEMERFKVINAKHRQAHFNAVWAFSIFLPFVELLSSLAIALLLAYGITNISVPEDVKPTYEEIISFTLWVSMLFRPIRQLADKFNVLQRGMVRAERVFKVLDDDSFISDEGTLEKQEVSGEIEFKNVKFAYVENEYVLNDVSFHVKPGETIAFVGATGAGKSTIINLMCRFYQLNDGEILVDGENINDYTLPNLRQHISLVPQDVFLFSDTIHNNITLKNDTISRDQVVNAAKVIGAHHFIEKLPNGYDFNVGERGGMLSVGQRQLISFIRAYVYNPSILVLDEATSSIDTESEEMIQRATNQLTTGRTSVVIAHRLSTIQNADKIYVMEKGRIIEWGSHRELLSKDGQYKRLYELQFAD